METIQNPDFTLAVECRDLILQIRINDVVLFKNRGERKTSGLWMNDFIIDGVNTLEMNVEPPAYSASSGIEPSADAFARVVVQKNNTPVYSFQYPPDAPDSPTALPTTASGEFESGTQHGLWAWQRSDEIELNEETSAAATTHLRRLFEACEAKDVERAVEMFGVKIHERAVAFYRNKEECFQQEREFFNQRLNNPVWELETTDDDRIRYELCGNRRMIAVKTPNGASVLKWIDYKGMNTDIPLYLSMMNGQWMIVR